MKMRSLLSSHMEGDDGKSLLAHSFPIDNSRWLAATACSSRITWQATKSQEFCKDIYTHQDWASWCGAATKAAVMKIPMDPDGLCLHMRLLAGIFYVILEDSSLLAKNHQGVVLGGNDRLYEPEFSSVIASLIDNIVL